MEDKEKKKMTYPHRMGVERAWQTSFAMPVPKVLVHCIIDFFLCISLFPLESKCPMACRHH
jgi:hypothetical protein